MAWQDFFTGTNDVVKQNKLRTPGQENIINKLGQQGLSGLQNINTSFEPIAQRAREQFGQVGIPSISERFTQGGAQRSSAFGQSIGQGGADLEAQLAAQQSQHNLGQQGLFAQLAQLGLTPQFENYIEQGNKGLFGHLGNAIPSFAQGLGNGLGSFGGLGYLSSLFGKGQQNQQQGGQQSGGAIQSQYSPANPADFNIPGKSQNPNLMNLLQMLYGQQR